MGYTLQRTAYTIYVKFTGDFAAGLLTRDGEMAAYSYPCGDPPFILGNAKFFIESLPEQDYQEGDIIISNDPYFMGGFSTHLPDISMIKPIFYKGELICFAWCFIHSSDIGGAVPGSVMLTNDEIFQEGLRIPPLKLYKVGKLNEDLLRIYQANVRIPEDNWGDLQAMVSALNVGEVRFHEAIARYGVETIKQALQDVIEWGQIRAEKVIEEIPEGVSAEFAEFLDDDAVSDVPVRMKAKITKKGKKLYIDWTGTDPQARSAINLITQGNGFELIALFFMLYSVSADPGMPLNAGMRRVLHMHIPEGSLLNPTFPAAGAARGVTFIRAFDVFQGCLIQLLPGKVPAANGGVGIIVNLSEPDLESDILGKKNMLVLQPLTGGCGARPYKDGMDVRPGMTALPFSNPIEVIEGECSIKVREWNDRIDSGGAGKYRGGNGFVFEFEVSTPNTIITARGSGRLNTPPWGVKGGKPAQKTKVTLNPGTDKEKVLDKNIDWLRLDPGDVVRFETPGGGGYGNPLERDVEKVVYDVKQGLVSAQAAEKDYGVIIKDDKVDYEETKKLREEMMKSYEYKEFDFGSYREQYERVWTPELYDELIKILYSLPTDYRNYIKWKLAPNVNALAKQKTVDKGDLIQEWEKLREFEEGLKVKI
jgi:N-methylhydantoinase B